MADNMDVECEDVTSVHYWIGKICGHESQIKEAISTLMANNVFITVQTLQSEIIRKQSEGLAQALLEAEDRSF